MYQNVFLDFLNRESRILYGMYDDFTDSQHALQLSRALNVAVFLCDEFCLTPPGPVAECHIAQLVLRKKAAFLEDRVVRLAIREKSLAEFFEKKLLAYAPHREYYPDLYSSRSREFVSRFPISVEPRHTIIGDYISERWQEGPDVDDRGWERVVQERAAREIALLRGIAPTIVARGQTVNWPTVRAEIERLKVVPDAVIRRLLQFEYFSAYIAEYNLRTITGLPFARVEFGTSVSDLRYDYNALRELLEALRIWNVIRDMSAESMLLLRMMDGYFRFRKWFDDLAAENSGVRSIAEIGALALRLHPSIRKHSDELNHLAAGVRSSGSLALSIAQLEAVGHRLGAISMMVDSSDVGRKAPRSINIPLDIHVDPPTIGLFVALNEEREFFVERWQLQNEYPERVWVGKVGKVNVHLYCSGRAGRVPATAASMKVLSETLVSFDLLIVLGICGGFAEMKVMRGDILAPEVVVDLSSRKVRDDTQGAASEFRPRVYNLDDRIMRFLNSGTFDRKAWQAAVVSSEYWPAGIDRLPRVYHASIASIDEVVSSDVLRKKLLEVSPGLHGVEMEAGGVIEAASYHGVPVGVVRGVSDFADPLKTDDVWRRLAMHATAQLVEDMFAAREFAGALLPTTRPYKSEHK